MADEGVAVGGAHDSGTASGMTLWRNRAAAC
jgi:hypothetical protein